MVAQVVIVYWAVRWVELGLQVSGLGRVLENWSTANSAFVPAFLPFFSLYASAPPVSQISYPFLPTLNPLQPPSCLPMWLHVWGTFKLPTTPGRPFRKTFVMYFELKIMSLVNFLSESSDEYMQKLCKPLAIRGGSRSKCPVARVGFTAHKINTKLKINIIRWHWLSLDFRNRIEASKIVR